MKSYSLHPCFHGGKNYVANTEYILYSAYKLGEKENKVRYQDVFPNNVDLYKMKGQRRCTKELGQATKQQLFKYCKKKAGKKKALTAKQKALFYSVSQFIMRRMQFRIGRIRRCPLILK